VPRAGLTTRPRAFGLLDAVRGLAALSVVLYHAVFKAYLIDHPGSALAPYAAHLDLGVPVFFVLSGFLLYRPFVAARLAGEPAPDANAYGVRRLRRIVPGYWVALALAGIAGATLPGFAHVFSAKGIVAYFGFLQIYNPHTASGGINPAWTLCVELTFYAFLPLWAAAVRRVSPGRRLRPELIGLGLLFCSSVAFQAFTTQYADPNRFGQSAAPWIEPLPNFLDHFALGMVLAVLSLGRWRDRAAPATTWLLAAFVVWVMSTQLGLHGARSDLLTPWTYLVRHQLSGVFAVLVLAPAIFGDARSGLPRRALRVPGLAFLGAISYGVYLYHLPVMVMLAHWHLLPRTGAEAVLYVALTLAATLPLAWLSYRLVEAPFLRGGSSLRAIGRTRVQVLSRRPMIDGHEPVPGTAAPTAPSL
jgi:peptidoglycan/LPS O-acetylase OafA/YrhL